MSRRPPENLHTWRIALVIVIAGLYAWIGLSSQGLDRVLGLLGTVLIVGAVTTASRSRPAAIAMLLLGALPLAVATWSSIVTPLLAVLVVVLAWPRRVPTPV